MTPSLPLLPIVGGVVVAFICGLLNPPHRERKRRKRNEQ